MTRKQPQNYEINLEFEGKNYSTTYSVSSNVVEVDSMYGHPKRTQIGGSTAEIVARMLFREILRDAKLQGKLNKI